MSTIYASLRINVTCSYSDRMSDDSLSDVGKEYILGVVEGFYGNPWTKDERFNLLKRMKEQNMNAYIYAPKGKVSFCKTRYNGEIR